ATLPRPTCCVKLDLGVTSSSADAPVISFPTPGSIQDAARSLQAGIQGFTWAEFQQIEVLAGRNTIYLYWSGSLVSGGLPSPDAEHAITFASSVIADALGLSSAAPGYGISSDDVPADFRLGADEKQSLDLTVNGHTVTISLSPSSDLAKIATTLQSSLKSQL